MGYGWVVIEMRWGEGERSVRRTYEVDGTPEGAECDRIDELVAELHPTAVLKSFEEGAATFIDDELVVVGRFVRSRPAPQSNPRGQDALFAS